MVEKYELYENAIAERFNGILKQEFEIVENIKNLDLGNNSLEI